MSGRIEVIEAPSCEIDAFSQIAQLGFPLLHLTPHANTSVRLAREAQGSPHLMQEFCRQICYLSAFREAPETPRFINPQFEYPIIFKNVAQSLSKSIYEKLAREPRPRTDRLQRKLKSGREADIYKVVLLALAHIKLEVVTIEYESPPASLREALADELPQAHEVSRVLEQMAKVSALDESSVPVIDYDPIRVPNVLRERREPKHEEFQPRTVLNPLYFFTEAFKEGALAELATRTEALHALLHSHVRPVFGRN